MPATPSHRASCARPGTGLSDLVWEVSAYIEAMGESALADTPLTLAASGMLCLVHDEPGITIAEISRRVPKSAQALGQVANRLRKLGFIERRLGDGLGIGLYLTATGRAMADVAFAREREVTDRLMEILGDQRYGQLSDLLGDIRELLSQRGSPRR